MDFFHSNPFKNLKISDLHCLDYLSLVKPFQYIAPRWIASRVPRNLRGQLLLMTFLRLRNGGFNVKTLGKWYI